MDHIRKNYWGSGGNLLGLGGIFSGEFGRNCCGTMCANQLEVANLQCGVARSQMFSAGFARCWCSFVVDGCELSDATTWTINAETEFQHVPSVTAFLPTLG